MKKFTFKGVLDNFRTSIVQPSRADQDIPETLRPEDFQVKRTFRHGFPFQPTAMAFDPVQKLLAIGTKCGYLRILGQPGVDINVRHDIEDTFSQSAVIHLQFVINEGALVTATADDSLHLWSLKQGKVPQIMQSLKFQKEKITCLHLPLQSKWLYIGTERGNIHVVQIDNFTLSGYVINWNKAIDYSRKTHPGSIVHLSDNPLDSNKLLLGFESGEVVLWDLKNKASEMRWHTQELRSISWHYEGKQFMCSHSDGTLTTWSLRSNARYVTISQPHAKLSKEGKAESCKPIPKVEWKPSRLGESCVIFSGGTPYDQAGRTPSITIIYNKITTVLEMEHPVIDFLVLCESIYVSELQEPIAILALLQNDLVVMDLQTAGFPCLENPYPMDLHESAVSCCTYLADCPADLIPAMYSVGRATSAGSRSEFSNLDWPICGGTWMAQSCSYSEVIVTGHVDGSLKFWDASAGALQVLYKLKTAKVFEKLKGRVDTSANEEPFAIHRIAICPESRKLCVAGASAHVILFNYKRFECTEDVTVLEIPIVYEAFDEPELSPDCQTEGTSPADNNNGSTSTTQLKVRTGPQKKPPGFQAQLVCLTPYNNGLPPSNISTLLLNSSYGLLAYGNEAGLVIVDMEQKVCLLNVGTPDLYGAQDPYSRLPRSPKKTVLDTEEKQQMRNSPSMDQIVGRIESSPKSSFLSPNPISSSGGGGTNLLLTSPLPVNSSSQPVIQSEPVVNRRKSLSAWKTLRLKHQLYRLDLRLKNESSKEKRNSVFYADKSSDDQPVLIDKEDHADNNERRETVNAKDEEAVKVNHSESNQTAPTVIRPDSLDLCDGGSSSEELRPLRPPRRVKKRQLEENSIKNERLLCVPSTLRHYQRSEYSNMVDLRDDCKDDGQQQQEVVISPQTQFTANLMRRFNKLDTPFSRSRSSSISSLDNISTEAIQTVLFADSCLKKTEPFVAMPVLWIGTSLGSVLPIQINLPEVDSRTSQSVAIHFVGATIFRVKGAILNLALLDCSGALITYSFEAWRDDARDKKDRTPTKTEKSNRQSPTLGEARNSGSSGSTESAAVTYDRQFLVISSEKQARVLALPSQTCLYKQQLAEEDFIVKSEVISLRDSACLACYGSNGHLTTYSLPSLRPLVDIDFLPISELRIARTFCFSNRGHGLYLTSPSELQKFTLCTEFCSNLTEMMGDLYLSIEMPEPPKEGFFKGFFGPAARTLDREQLFGESSGKASKSVAKHIPGSVQELSMRATSSTSEIGRAHKLAVERGEKLNQLEDRAERMRSEAEQFSSAAHDLMLKYKDKKWYQL